MPKDLAIGILAMLFGLALYSMGVWGCRRSGVLTRRHVGYLWAGLAADSVGTAFMARLAAQGVSGGSHSLTGLPVYLLMVVTAVFGTVAYLRRDVKLVSLFSRHAVWAWGIWVFSFVLGWAVSIPQMHA